MYTPRITLPPDPRTPIVLDVDGPAAPNATNGIADLIAATRFGIKTIADLQGEQRTYRATFNPATNVVEFDEPQLRLELNHEGARRLAAICEEGMLALEGFLSAVGYLALQAFQGRSTFFEEPSLDFLIDYAHAHIRYTCEERVKRLREQLQDVQRRRWAIELEANSPSARRSSRRRLDHTGWLTPNTPAFHALCAEESRLSREIVSLIVR